MVIDRTQIQNIYPLTPLQEGMFFHAQAEPDSEAYFEQWSLRLRGDVDPALVAAAWNALFARHEIFRSLFTPGDGNRPLQIVLRSRQAPFAVRDLSALASAEREARLVAERSADRRRGFRLGADPLVRVLLFNLSSTEWELLWSHHHIVLDGWSVGIVQEEFLRIYAALRAGTAPSLAAAPPFSQFVKSLPAQAETEFWRDYLATYETAADLPRTHTPGSGIDRLTVTLDHETTGRVDAACRAHGVTLSTFVQAIWGLLLARYAYADDVVFGYVMSGRDARVAGVERMVGMLINTVPVRVRLQDGETFGGLLARLQRAAADLSAHQQTPLVDIQRASGRQAPLFSHVVALENHPVPGGETPAVGFEITAATSDDRTHYGFDLVIIPAAGTLTFRLSWDRASHDGRVMERLAAQLRHVIDTVVSDPAVVPCRLNVLPPAQWAEAVEAPNRTAARYPDTTITALFEAQVLQRGSAPAVTAPHQSASWVSYQELNVRAAAVAAHLQHDLGVIPGSRVGVYLRPSIESIVSVLGILKAGCTYVPVDPRYPVERVRFLLEDSQVVAVLTAAAERRDLAATMRPLVDVDALPVADARAVSRPDDPDAIAYVIYTSGSTGLPKGCLVTHRNVVRLLVNDRVDFDFGPDDVWVMAHALSFDFSVWEIYGALLHGGRLVVASREAVQDVPAFRQLLVSHRVTVLNQTPRAFYNLAAIEDEAPAHTLGEHLRVVIFGGDRLEPAALRRWVTHYPAASMALVNMYGITETTVHVTYRRLSDAEIAEATDRSPIGRPLPETTVYVCDRHLNPQPAGAPGEMLVGGSGVCAGYLDRPALTAERFVADGFSGSGRLYRSGDLAWRDASGELYFTGRNDDQVKIRGHRVEPAEVQRALQAIAGIQHAAVIVDAAGGAPALLGCVVTAVDSETVRCQLAAVVPEYAVPATLVTCAALPLTAHGKLDVAAVRRLRDEQHAGAADAFEPPVTDAEQLLASVWSAVLNVERIGRQDRFLALGGDSIKSIQVLARLRARGMTLDLKDVFEYPTLASLATRLRERRARAAARDEGQPFALTSIQRRFFEEHPVDPAHYNQALLLRCARRMDLQALRQALQQVGDAHGALRLRFQRAGGGSWQQRVAAAEPVAFSVADLTDVSDPAAAMFEMSAAEQQGMHLSDGPLFRAALYRWPDADRLLLVAHHLAVDGVTWRILLEDLDAALAGAPLLERTDSLAAWSEAQQAAAVSGRFAAERPLWSRMDDAGQTAADPRLHPRLHDRGTYGDAVEELLDWTTEDTADLRQACAAYQTNIGELVLAGAARALGRWTGHEAMQVALEGHGRDALPDVDVSRTAGWFTSLYPVVLDLGDGPVHQRVRALKETLRRIPAGGAGYGILRYLSQDGTARALRARPPVCFNYLGELQVVAGGTFAPCADRIAPAASPHGPRPFAIEIAAIVTEGALRVALAFAAGTIDRGGMRQLRDALDEELRRVVAHCLRRAAPELTPADLTHKALTLEELDGVFDDD